MSCYAGVVLTDGESNRDSNLVQSEAELSRKDGVSLFVIGIGDSVNMQELQSVANKPYEEYLFMTHDFSDLSFVKQKILDEIGRNVGQWSFCRQLLSIQKLKSVSY